MRFLNTGEAVRVRQLGSSDDWCYATVALTSRPESVVQSVALDLSGVVRAGTGIITGVLPLMLDLGARTATGLTGDEYELEARRL